MASVLSECYPGVPLVCGDACYSGEDSELHLGLSLCLVLYPVKDVGARNPVIMVSELGRLSIFSWDGSLLTWPHKTIQGECSDLFGVNIASDDDDALRLNLPIVEVITPSVSLNFECFCAGMTTIATITTLHMLSLL